MSIEEKLQINSNSDQKSSEIQMSYLFLNNPELQSHHLLKSNYDFQANSNFFNSSILKESHPDLTYTKLSASKTKISDFASRMDSAKPESPKNQVELKKRTIEEMWTDCMEDFESEEDMFSKSEDEHSVSEFTVQELCLFEKVPKKHSTGDSDHLLDFRTFLEKFEKKAETKNSFLCPQCPGKFFTSKQALGGHFGQVHRGESFQYLRRLKVKNQNQQVRKRLGYYKELKKPEV